MSCALLAAAALLASTAGEDETELFKLESVLNAETKVASHKAMTLRETPGVVTVISREEIERSGARDLLELLILVPGFAGALDVQGVVSLGVRGNWGHEGKVLLLVDGLEMNETLFSTVQLGQHLPLEVVQSVEVVRGPGSVLYGGFAELAVINVITRGAKDLGNAELSAGYARMKNDLGRRTLALSAGHVFDELSLTFSGAVGDGNRSDRTYQDFVGRSYDMSGGNSRLSELFLDVGASYRGLKARLIFDDQNVVTGDAYTIIERPVGMQFLTTAAEVLYEARLGSLSITPRLTYKQQTPWRNRDADLAIFYDKTAERTQARLALAWDAVEGLRLDGGVEYTWDSARLNDPRQIGSQTRFPTPDGLSVSYGDAAAFGEVLLATAWGNLLAGARAERHSEVGWSVVPRAAFTKRWGALHLKLLASGAYRAPGIENIALSSGIVPERTMVLEVEAGLQLGESAFFSANLFDIGIRHPIIYAVVNGVTGAQEYENFGKTGTKGIEAELRWQRRGYGVQASWSFYSAGDLVPSAIESALGRERDPVSLYAVPGTLALRGLPQQKATLQAHASLWRALSINTSMTLMGPRYGALLPSGGLQQLDTMLLADLFLLWKDAFTRGLTLSLGVKNLFDAHDAWLQAYDSGHAPLPGPSREVFARATMAF
jgi:outer membrane cobalamin receptor